MIRPWYRSRLLWLGVPGLVFLLWVGWDSGHHYTQAQWHGSASHQVELAAGRLSWVAYAEIGPAPGTRPERFLWKRSSEVANPGSGSKRAPQWDLPAGFEYSKRNLKHGPASSPTYQVTTARVAWWLVIVCYGVPWLAGWGGWQVRKAGIIQRDWPEGA